MKKILKSAGRSNTNRIRAPMWYIRLWRSPPPETFIIYDDSSSPSADDYLMDADRSALRLLAGYPSETYL